MKISGLSDLIVSCYKKDFYVHREFSLRVFRKKYLKFRSRYCYNEIHVALNSNFYVSKYNRNSLMRVNMQNKSISPTYCFSRIYTSFEI